MRHLLRRIRKQAGPLVGACALLAAGIGGCVVAGAGTAQAVTGPCPGTPVIAGTACTDTGTLNFTAGNLYLTVPTAMNWTGTDNGLNQLLVDTNVLHQSFIVNDATGSGAGWKVTASATTFTSSALTLPDTNAFAINGALALSAGALATTAPTVACTTGSTCTPPTNTAVTYPVLMTTAASSPTAYVIYHAALTTGLGSITIGLPGANPVGWWVAVPGNAVPSTSYTSTITLQVVTGP